MTSDKQNFWLATLLVLLLIGPIARAGNARKPTLETLGNQVQCPCGCVAPLNQCPHFDCAEKAQIQAFLKKEIADGKDEATILQDLSARWGMQALTAPPAKGFNLTVWILPGVGLLVGLGIVMVIVRRWKSKPSVEPVLVSGPLDPKVQTAMEEEIKATGMG